MHEHCLRDEVGREIRYLRLSVTAQCGLRCIYCQPGESCRDVTRRDSGALTNEEIETLVRYLVGRWGLRKVRLTGGEPTCRPDLLPLVRRLSRVPGLAELTMTTNGLTLVRQARELAAAGLRRINVSLDALDPAVFAWITGGPGVEQVMAGIEAAVRAGLTPVKLNTVVLRGINDGELPGLVRFAAARRLEVRFIELMPMGPLVSRWPERFVSADEMREMLSEVVTIWQPIHENVLQTDPARAFRVRLKDGGWARVGFVAAMSTPFCTGCNRIRVAADGTFYPCLMGPAAGALRPALRPRFDADQFEHLLTQGLYGKAPTHSDVGVSVMTQIGG
jgi:cyclic pyranopterin phosphate synthase